MNLFLSCCLLLGQVPGSLDFDPRLSWYTLETEHFAVHFSARGRPNDERRALAQEVADICEGVHATLAPAAGWEPKGRTQVVVADFYDYLNGWAAPFPGNTITILPSPPGGSRANDDDWLRNLILHEYSHILQMDRVAGVPAALRAVFGRIVLPNALAPAWLHEGYAVYNETRFSNSGRLRSAEYDMMARAAADAGRLLSADRCGGYELQRYPAGEAAYLYGSLLHRCAAGDAGPDIWDVYNASRSAGLPYFENWHARRVVGKSIYRLWGETGQSIRSRAGDARRRIGNATPLRRLTREGCWTSSPLWSRSGSEVYYLSRTGREYPSIRAVDTMTGDVRVLLRGRVYGNLSLSADGRKLAFARTDVVRRCYELSDIYALDLVHGNVSRLTNGERARDPDFAPDTGLLAYISNQEGRHELKLLDLATGSSSVLLDADGGGTLHGPRFSPSGKWVAVGVSRPGGFADIELVDRRTGWTVPVTADRACDLSPCWSRTGRFLLFASDRSGVFNLYAYELASGRTYRCTDVLYGAFEPAVSPDNRRIALISHSADGDNVCVAGYDFRQWQVAQEFVDTLPKHDWTAPATPSALYYYNPFPAAWPRFWLPWASLDAGRWELGAFTLGWDALQFHRYQFRAGARQDNWRPFVAGTYELRRYWPVLSLSLDADATEQVGVLGAGFSFPGTLSAHRLDLAADVAHDTGFDGRAEAEWAFSNAHSYRFDVAPTEGRVIGIYADGQKQGLLSNNDRVRLLGYWSEYVGRPPATWSLRFRFAAGTGLGDSTARSAFHLDNRPGLLSVRGYETGRATGRTVAAAGLQFRMPLAWVERGIGTGPLFLRNLNGALFVDGGLTSLNLLPDAEDLHQGRVGVGAELRIDLMLGHFVPAGLTAGIGVGLNPWWSHQGYVGLESPLPAGLTGRRRHGELAPRFATLP